MKTVQQNERLNILLADDDTDDYIFFREALKDSSTPMQLTVVQDGEQLMQMLCNETNPLPHALFLDLNMPRKNGFECLSEIRLNEKLKQLPVIIYSTSFHSKVADMLYKCGANYYISKPFQISELKKAVQQIITDLEKNTMTQPGREDFILLAEERKNYKTFSWFKKFLKMPDEEKFN